MKNIKITELKRYLKMKSDKELVNEIVDLFKLSSKVKEYYNLKVDPDNEELLLKDYKQIVEEQFFPSRGNSVLEYKILKDAISNFEKLSNKPENVADLMLTYVENGVEFTNTYGEIDERFYNNIARMYFKTLQYILENNLEDKYKKRCEDAIAMTGDIGYGFGMEMEDIYYNAFPDDEEDDE